MAFTKHALFRISFRQLEEGEITRNLVDPGKLVFARKQGPGGENKFECYFAYSNSLAHKYVVVLNAKIKVITVIKIKRKWQKMVEKYARR